VSDLGNPIAATHLQVERIALGTLFERARNANMLAPLPALLLAWIVSSEVPLRTIAIWLILNALPDLVSYWMCTALVRKPPPDERLQFWHRWQIGLRTLQGLSWGSSAVLFHVAGPGAVTNDLSILVVLLATAAIATINMAPSLFVQSGFTVGILSVPLLTYLSYGDLQHVKFAVGIGVAMLALLQFGYDAAKNFRDGARELVRSQQLSKELEELSVTDSLTGLANRRKLAETLQSECARAMRQSTSVSVVMVDVDLFKKYNDFYGHQAGDLCLQKIAAVLQRTARRAGELAARYGGEEFVVLRANCSQEEAAALAEAVRAEIEALALPHPSSASGIVTASFGVAAGIPQRDATGDALIRSADNALFEAKRAGRNRVRLGGGWQEGGDSEGPAGATAPAMATPAATTP
jgi:diguanylate cyclase (GGDEF)-like protein